mmetsp:Transcript_4239/g.13499  ORF Transcript_4239/g.13499 Transcript_4239/m.13499 type:complete len:589 (-) Transcript_4239:126-1892(-)
MLADDVEADMGMFDVSPDPIRGSGAPPKTPPRGGMRPTTPRQAAPPSSAKSVAKAVNDARFGNVSRIQVMVRKRPMNKKEEIQKQMDVVVVEDDKKTLTVYEPRTKVDLTKYVEQHQFKFDEVLAEDTQNEYVYTSCVQPVVQTIFGKGKATCFAYGQTGSGKTHTMEPLPMRAAHDILRTLQDPEFHHLSLWVSNFEIYGGKVFDLLNGRRKLCLREDAKGNVVIVGLQEHKVDDPNIISQLIEHGAGARSTGSTGANADSSRSHGIIMLALKEAPKPVPMGMRAPPGASEEGPRGGRLWGKFSFIDLAGSERGADTYNNDRQTRLEGAEINKSLLALKECIRALDLGKSHIPFRGSKLTEVLRDSFVGNSYTIMIANISPSSGSCEHTLNTLRYAYRVKELGGSGDDDSGEPAPARAMARQVSMPTGPSGPDPRSQPFQPSAAKKNQDRGDISAPSVKVQRSASERGTSAGLRRPPPEPEPEVDEMNLLTTQRDELMNTILEEEEEVIAAHRKQIEETMEIVRKEMTLLAEVDQPGSAIDTYVAQLADILQRKAASIRELQDRLASFQGHLREEEILSQSMGARRR